jgi:hypothetical protein
MRDRIELDPDHSLAISQEVGERLQALLNPRIETPPSLREQIERLGDQEAASMPLPVFHAA